MQRKFPEELEIKLDEHQNNIDNLQEILENIKKITNKNILKNCLEYYFRMMENYDSINSDQLREIVESLKTRNEEIDMVENIESLDEAIVNVKNNNTGFNNISIIETSKVDNDNTDGLKRDVSYLEMYENGEKVLYEIENVAAVRNIMNNTLLISDKTENEIKSLLYNYCKPCDIINMSTGVKDFPMDNFNYEMDQINSVNVRDVISNNDGLFLKERVDFKEYVDKYKGGGDISYALNSNGERIYIIGDEKYKYVGKDRELTKLSKDGKDEIDSNVASFNSDMKGKGDLPNINLADFTNIRNFLGMENLLMYIMKAMEYNIGISEKQNDFMANFVIMCEECRAIGIPIPGNLRYFNELFIKKFGMEKLKYMKDKVKPMDLEKENVKRLELRPPKNKMSNLEKAGFISVAVILEGSLILVGILSILAVIKK